MKKNKAPKNAAARKVHYVLSTHWDREWYQTFQDYRRRLVHLLDRQLDDIESGALRGPFTTDGQAIILDDYLEIRPERRKQVEAFARNGRLNIGPWYVLPDEWLVSGESIIRNLRLGRAIARSYGGTPSSAGFVCDLFGHISQLPQIAKGFGIRAGLIWRGLEPRKAAHFRWRGADGTELPCYRFGRTGYCDYSWDVRRSTEPRTTFEQSQALTDLKAFLAKEAARTDIPPLLIFDGGDHLEYDADHYRLLFAQQVGGEFPYEVAHSTLDAYLEDVVAHENQIKDVVEGELREAARISADRDLQWLIPGVLSSRVWIKQANAECQSLLCQWAEPFSVLDSLLTGAPAPRGYLDAAWRWLLQNHPHDSICGCSIDEVHEDMKYRFAQARQIASAQTEESLRSLAAAVAGDLTDKELRVLIANPLARTLDETVTLTLHIPTEWGTYQEFFGFEPKPGFRIYTADGKEVAYQLLTQEMGRTKARINPLKYPEGYKTNDITVALRLKLPALGYTTLTVKEGAWMEKSGPVSAAMLPTRHALTPGLATTERSMANALLSVMIEPNGSLTVTDKRTGHTYERLLTFEDTADIGDGWFHGHAVNDQCFVSGAAHADIALLHNGPLLARFRVRVALNLPEEFAFDKGTRSERMASLVVDNLVTLRADSDRIEVVTSVDNRIKDHRLRVLFPTEASEAKSYLADTAFDAVERPIGLPADNHLGRELSVETTPQQTWTSVVAGTRGLAVVSSGLPESCVRDQPDRSIALTLFRSTRRTVLTDGQPEGQVQGKMVFNYWIVPQTGKVGRSSLFDAGLRLAASVRTVQLRNFDLPIYRRKGTGVPAESSLFVLEGPAVLSSVRQEGDAVEIRLFNPDTTKGVVTLLPGTEVWRESLVTRVDLESRATGSARKAGARFALSMKPKEIVTLRFSSPKKT
ncbi:MAG: glycoside hydrolase [Rariglobus sp.]|jgi:alpha-mannosidase/mannosylglycerate hydrolase|nr:glycoside hydrolase [Rariglobus sp.]